MHRTIPAHKHDWIARRRFVFNDAPFIIFFQREQRPRLLFINIFVASSRAHKITSNTSKLACIPLHCVLFAAVYLWLACCEGRSNCDAFPQRFCILSFASLCSQCDVLVAVFFSSLLFFPYYIFIEERAATTHLSLSHTLLRVYMRFNTNAIGYPFDCDSLSLSLVSPSPTWQN